jgi:hypothetical protein
MFFSRFLSARTHISWGGAKQMVSFQSTLKQKWLDAFTSNEFKTFIAKQKQNSDRYQTNPFKLKSIGCPLTLSFTDMSLILKNDNKVVLSNIFGKIQPFNITALMGMYSYYK